jgi:hypothetical protein
MQVLVITPTRCRARPSLNFSGLIPRRSYSIPTAKCSFLPA